MCVHVVGDVRVKESRNDPRIAKRSKKEQESAMFKNMPRLFHAAACADFRG